MKPTLHILAFTLVAAAIAAACDAEQPGDRLQTDPGAAGNAGAGAGEGADPAAAAAEVPQPISAVACLRKMSLDLTNKGPTLQEVDAVKSGTKSLGDMADAYLGSQPFSDVVLNWFLGKFEPTPKIPAGADTREPARIAQYLVTNDIDFRELVTADYTVGTDGAKKTIGPAAAGVLTTQAYLSAYTGVAYRNWAGRVLKGMAGIALAPVTVVPEGIDASREGLAANPTCAACHVHPVYGVDFAAAFHDCHDVSGLPIASCTPQKDLSFLGQTGRSLPDLGKILSGSVEWRATMIQTFYTELGGRPIAKNELAQYRASEDAWVAAGYRPKALLKQIVTSTQYCSR